MVPLPLPRNVDYVDELFSTNNINAAVRNVSPFKSPSHKPGGESNFFRDEVPGYVDVSPIKRNMKPTTKLESNRLKNLGGNDSVLNDITGTSNMILRMSLMKTQSSIQGSSLPSVQEHSPTPSLQPSDFDLPPRSTSTPQEQTFLKTPSSIFSNSSKRVKAESTPNNQRTSFNVGQNFTPMKQSNPGAFDEDPDGYSTPNYNSQRSQHHVNSPDINTNLSILSFSFLKDISIDDSFEFLDETPLAHKTHRQPQPAQGSDLMKDEISRVMLRLKNSKLGSDFSPLNTDDYIAADVNNINFRSSGSRSSEGISLPDVGDSFVQSRLLTRSDRTLDYNGSAGKKRVRIDESILVIPDDLKTLKKISKRSLRISYSSSDDDNDDILKTPIPRKKIKTNPLRNAGRYRFTHPPPDITPSVESNQTIPDDNSAFSDLLKQCSSGKDPLDLLS